MRTKKIEEPTYLQYKKYAKGGELKDVESTAKAFVAKDYDGLTKQQRQKKLANDLGWDTYEEMANDDTVDNKYARADVTENGENAGMIADIDYALNQSDFEEAQNIFDELNKKVESLLSKEQTPPELKDVESTAKALEKINLYEINENFINDFQEKILEKFDEEKISNIQYLRHELHSESPKNIFYSESNDFDNKIEEVANNISELDITGKENEVSKKIMNFYDYESGNRKSESSFEYEEDMEHDDYYNLAYSEISEEKEKINKIIEEYLFDLDEIWDNYNLSEISDIRKNKTFAPSGYMRARSILGKESLSNIKYKKFDNKIIYKISEAYHSAKADGSNPKLVKEVEKVLSNNYAKGGELNTYENNSDIKKTIFFWHGGNLNEYNEIIAQKSGRYEYGAGLYLTTKWEVASKYAKGSRKMYKVEVELGVDISDSNIDIDVLNEFIDKYVITAKRKEIKQRIEKYNKEGKVKGNIFNNIILNEKAIKSSNTYKLREFFVENGIDYEIVNNAFGWGEDMMVLYNMKKIVKTEIVSNKNKIEDYDLKPINDNRIKEFSYAKGGVSDVIYSEKFNIQKDGEIYNTKRYAEQISKLFNGTVPKNTTTNSFYFQIFYDGKKYDVRVSDHPSKFEEKNFIYDYSFDLSGKFLNDYKYIYEIISGNKIKLYNEGDKITHFRLGDGKIEKINDNGSIHIKFVSGKEGDYEQNIYKIKNNSFTPPELVKAVEELLSNNYAKGGELKDENGYLKYTIEDDELIIDKIKVYKQRLGTGKKLIKEVKEIAAKKKLPITLYAYPQDETINEDDLKEFYYSQGFDLHPDDVDGNLFIYGSLKKYAKGGALNTYKNKYNRKYGYPENENHNLEQISKDTGVSLKGLQQIYNKGIGAYKTNPESVRKNVHSKEQWAMGRVYSAVMGGKASKVDANELKMANGGELDYITKLEKEYNSKSLDELMAINKKLYSKVDIESAMSAEEKLLKKIIAKKFSDINQQIIERRRLKKLEKMAKGGEIQSMINEGIVEIEFYDTTIAHAKEYGIESKKPLYLKRIFVSENNRNKGLGKKLIKYLYDFAVENGNDVIFGHIATKSSYIEILKHLLLENGYTINDKNNDFYIMITKENKYNTGGDLKKSNIISLPDTYSSYDSLKPILENQGYELIKKNNLEMSTEKLEIEDNRSVSELDMKYPELPHSFINKQLMSGIEHEMEHTEDPRVAKKIAIDHLLENIHYYEYLAEMEQKMQGKNIDEHYESITKMYEEGGKVETFEFSTPTGKTSKLNYLQQVLVRTKAFKNFFGDWELAARNYQNGKLDFYEAYKNVSKCIDDSTLEPRVVYHGTQADKEFFTFDVTQEKKIGRPYAYFAYNREYSLNFSGGTNKGYMYAVFLNIRNPFNASGETFLKNRDSSYWLTSIKGQISLDKYGDVTKRKELSDTIDSQIKSYIEEVYTNQPYYFWLLMARDVNKDFKYFLMSHGYDGIFASENYTTPFDTENPSEFTYTYIAFDANQIKLADGRNIDFDPMNADIRYEEGGKTVEKVEVFVEQQEPTQNVSQIDYLRNNLRKFSEKDAEINQTIFKSGGHVQKDSGSPDDAKDGGLFVGRSHATGGIKAINLSTNQPIEVEGGEVIITKPAVEDQTKREFEGKMMTNKEILSHINQSGGGVSFEKGGEMGNSCGCSGKMYKFGGETISDYMVLRKISTIYDESIKNVKNYVDNLSEQFK